MKGLISRIPDGTSAPLRRPVEPVDAVDHPVDAVDPQVSPVATAAPLPAGEYGYTILIPAPAPESKPDRTVLGWFEPTIIPAAARLIAAVGCAVAMPVYNGAALAPLYAGFVVRYCGAGATGPHASGGHSFAGFVCVVTVWWTWRLDPGAKPDGAGRHDAAKAWWHVKHFLSRVLRWSAILGSAAVPPLAAGILHVTTGIGVHH